MRIEASNALRKVTAELDSNDNARQLLSDSATWKLRQEAAQKLGVLGAGAVRHTGTLARAALKDPCGDVRGAAAEALLTVTAALGKAAKPQHAKDVAELLHAPEQSVAVQQQAAIFMGAHREALMETVSKPVHCYGMHAACRCRRCISLSTLTTVLVSTRHISRSSDGRMEEREHGTHQEVEDQKWYNSTIARDRICARDSLGVAVSAGSEISQENKTM